MSGTLYGLGIGPGDPDLITVKAKALLGVVPVIAYPAPEGGTSLVRAIADRHVPAGRCEIVIVTPMAADRFPAHEVYDRYAGIIAAHLDAGRDVAVLCEGDPFLYGSFMYLYERLASRYPAKVIPGVSSLGAVAAAAGARLASRDEVLTVMPATLAEDELAARLALTDAAAIMKVGRHLAKVRRVLSRLGLAAVAHYVERASMAEERVLPLDAAELEVAPYFSMVLVRRAAAEAAAASAPAVGARDAAATLLPRGAAILALSPGGLALARRLQPILPASRVHGLAGRADDSDESFTDSAAHLRALFAAGTPIIGICAAGILIRALAPLLADKRTEPPVVAVAETGAAAVPLLGGHHGANRLASAIAAATGGAAAITTGGDARLGLALDDPPPGWRLANRAAAKAITAALLAERPVHLSVAAGDGAWLRSSSAPLIEGSSSARDGCFSIRVTDRRTQPSATMLVFHPPVLAVGVGCVRGAPADELIELVEHALAGHGLAAGAVACVASLDLKADEPAVHALAERLGVPARFFTSEALEHELPRLSNPSDVVFREVGCHGVCEGAALAAAGPEATLFVTKTRSARATCAIARSRFDIDPRAAGRPRGRLTVVGIGPGQSAWRTPEATAALGEADSVVGLSLYLDLIADLVAGKDCHVSELTEEEARVRRALDLAAEGRRVCLVSSGDAGVYGLATLVFELLEAEDRPAWNRIEIVVAPGISALQAAAARIGAPLGHDFCAVSLSDLLTPWGEIERRVAAAAAGDFVVALYNPVSQRRRDQLSAARDILLRHRPASTPVVLARNLGRTGERVEVITLDALVPDRADMLTVILVGNRQTRLIRRGMARWVYTPRGYACKRGAEPPP
jgi:cobalt-precorrin 5A hydrolase/precorrin-3B C17-methyltransferase